LVQNPNSTSIALRLQEYFRRLTDAPPASSADEALALVCDLLDEVEDELSGIPKREPPPSPGMSDGRMYPPLADRIKHYPDGGLIAISRAHTVEIASDGSITIVNKKSKEIEIIKAGRRV
jgi:hypothetical protein